MPHARQMACRRVSSHRLSSEQSKVNQLNVVCLHPTNKHKPCDSHPIGVCQCHRTSIVATIVRVILVNGVELSIDHLVAWNLSDNKCDLIVDPRTFMIPAAKPHGSHNLRHGRSFSFNTAEYEIRDISSAYKVVVGLSFIHLMS